MLLFCVGSAHAQSVALDTSACIDPDPSEVRRLLALELPLLPEGESTPDALPVRVTCADASAHVFAHSLERELSLSSVPSALRARLLALAIAEVAGHKPAVDPPPPPVPVPVPVPERTRAPDRYRLWLGAHGQLSSLAAAGGALGSSILLRPWFAWSSGVAFTQGNLSIDAGELRVRHASAHTGPALQHTVGRVTLLAGAGVRAGWLGLRGEPRDAALARGQRFDTWFVGPTVFSSAALRFASHGLLVLALELGNTLREVNAEVRGGQTRTLSSWLGGASVGAGASW